MPNSHLPQVNVSLSLPVCPTSFPPSVFFSFNLSRYSIAYSLNKCRCHAFFTHLRVSKSPSFVKDFPFIIAFRSSSFSLFIGYASLRSTFLIISLPTLFLIFILRKKPSGGDNRFTRRTLRGKRTNFLRRCLRQNNNSRQCIYILPLPSLHTLLFSPCMLIT